MGMDTQKSIAESGSTVTVAVADTGVTQSHAIFADTTFVEGYDFVNGDNDPKDDNWHGTAVAGVIAESTPSNVRIMPLKVMNAKGEGSTIDILNALDYADEHGADIVNMSLGGYINNYNSFRYVGNYFKHFKALLVCAAGNESKNMDEAGVNEFPGEYDETLCVGAITTAGNRTSFSNYGAAVDFAAPGASVKLAYYNGGTRTANGTSFASPYVAAAAAIVKAEHGYYSNAEIKQALINTSVDLGSQGKDVYFGNGCPKFEAPVAPVEETIQTVPSEELTEAAEQETAEESKKEISDNSGREAIEKIDKIANPITIKTTTAKVSASKLKKSARTIKINSLVRITNAQGKLTYKKLSGSSKFKINKTTGRVTVKKNTKKGTYRIKVNINASGNQNFKSASKTVTLKIKVK